MPQIMKPTTCQHGAACNLDKGMTEGVGQHRGTIGVSEHQAIFYHDNIGDCYNGCHESAQPSEARYPT